MILVFQQLLTHQQRRTPLLIKKSCMVGKRLVAAIVDVVDLSKDRLAFTFVLGFLNSISALNDSNNFLIACLPVREQPCEPANLPTSQGSWETHVVQRNGSFEEVGLQTDWDQSAPTECRTNQCQFQDGWDYHGCDLGW
jgi:hypothetical protein